MYPRPTYSSLTRHVVHADASGTPRVASNDVLARVTGSRSYRVAEQLRRVAAIGRPFIAPAER